MFRQSMCDRRDCVCLSMNRQWSHPLQWQEEHPVMDLTQLHKTQKVQQLEGNKQTEHNQPLLVRVRAQLHDTETETDQKLH